jgi:hypothetical protein
MTIGSHKLSLPESEVRVSTLDVVHRLAQEQNIPVPEEAPEKFVARTSA